MPDEEFQVGVVKATFIYTETSPLNSQSIPYSTHSHSDCCDSCDS